MDTTEKVKGLIDEYSRLSHEIDSLAVTLWGIELEIKQIQRHCTHDWEAVKSDSVCDSIMNSIDGTLYRCKNCLKESR